MRVLLALSLDANFHRHALECVGRPDETAGHGHDLPDVARNCDGDQIEAADAAVRRIEGDPACTWHIDFRPGMGRPRTPSPYNVLIRIIEITGYDPRPETEIARRFDEEDREIPAGPPPAVQGLGWRLGAFVLPALIVDPL